MGRFWVSAATDDDDDDDDDDGDGDNSDDDTTTAASNTGQSRHAQHCDHDGDDQDDEASGIWKHERWQGPLVQMTAHSPQNNSHGMDFPPSADADRQFHFPGSLPSVALPRRRQVVLQRPQNSSSEEDDDEDYDDQALEEYEHHQQQLDHPYEYTYQQHPPKPTFSWFRIFLFAMVAHLLARYGPVAPPPDPAVVGGDAQQQQQHTTWEIFWVQELRGLWRSTKLLGYTMPKYVLEWVATGVWDDLQEAYRSFSQQRQREAEYHTLWANCSLQLPPFDTTTTTNTTNNNNNNNNNKDSWDLEYIEEDVTDDTMRNQGDTAFRYRLVGQASAVHTTTQALDAWEQSAPLLLYFAGSKGTGKLELAHQISRRVFGHCCDKDDINESGDIIDNYCHEKLLQSGSSSPVLALQGRDFGTKEHSEDSHEKYIDESSDGQGGEDEMDKSMGNTADEASKQRSTLRAVKVQLYETILRHTEWHPNGTVVILQHPEESAEGLLATLIQDLTQPSRHISTTQDRVDGHQQYSTDNGNSPIPQSLASRLQQACRRTVFMVTSHVGSRTIASSIRSYGGIDSIPPLELDIMLMHELDTQYVVTPPSFEASQSSSTPKRRRTPVVEVGSKFHSVAPFYPLTQSSLANILKQKVQQWSSQQAGVNSRFPSSLQATQAFVDVLLGSSRVEYLTVVRRSTQTSLLTFSSAGAQFLRVGSPIMNSWEAPLKRCLRDFITANKSKPPEKEKVAPPNVEEEAENELREAQAKRSGNHNGEAAQLLLSQPISKNAILHYDDFEESAVVFFCSIDRTIEEIGDYSLEAFSDCKRMCQFPL